METLSFVKITTSRFRWLHATVCPYSLLWLCISQCALCRLRFGGRVRNGARACSCHSVTVWHILLNAMSIYIGANVRHQVHSSIPLCNGFVIDKFEFVCHVRWSMVLRGGWALRMGDTHIHYDALTIWVVVRRCRARTQTTNLHLNVLFFFVAIRIFPFYCRASVHAVTEFFLLFIFFFILILLRCCSRLVAWIRNLSSSINGPVCHFDTGCTHSRCCTQVHNQLKSHNRNVTELVNW